jgi:tetratricopeptide (TPR) repeat protein
VQLDTVQRKTALLTATGLLAVGSIFSISRSAIAEKAGTADDPSSLRRAAEMETHNAARHYWVGRVALFVEQDPSAAVREFEETTRLNPWVVDYWLDLALAYKATGDTNAETRALDRALRAEPKNLNAAVMEGNFYLSRGDKGAAMQRFREVLENDPPEPVSIIDTCWRATHDPSAVLAALPPRADLHFRLLELLVRHNEPDAAAQVWQRILSLHQPFDSGNPLAYVDWLVRAKQPARARAAWDQIQAADKASSTSSGGGLLFNAGFEDDLRNAGFDWRFNNTGAVILFQDDDNPHSGRRALAITYNGASTTDAGVWQLFPATPGSAVRLTAYARTKDLLSAIPPRLGIQDYYSGTLVATGPQITESSGWQPTSVDFIVPPGADLLAIRIVQGPQPTRAKGTLWLDDFELSVSSTPPSH